MADYIGKFRTNYFKVTNPEKLKQLVNLQPCSTKLIERADEFVILGNEWDEVITLAKENGDEYDVNWIKELQKILPDNEILIFQEIGSENHRYLAGGGYLVSKTEVRTITLTKVVIDMARDMCGDDERQFELED